MLGVYGGLTLVLRARRAATLQQGHYRVAAPSVSSDHWSAADSDFKLEPLHRQWFRVWAATLGGERLRADDVSTRRQAPESWKDLVCTERSSGLRGPCGPASSSHAVLTAMRPTDARCPAGPGETSGAGVAGGPGLHGT